MIIIVINDDVDKGKLFVKLSDSCEWFKLCKVGLNDWYLGWEELIWVYNMG